MEGIVSLSVSFDNVTFSTPWGGVVTDGCNNQNPAGFCAGNPCLQYFALFSAAVAIECSVSICLSPWHNTKTVQVDKMGGACSK